MIHQLHCSLLWLTAVQGVPTAEAVDPGHTPREIKVLLVNGRTTGEGKDQATFFLSTALNLFDDKQPPEQPRVRSRVVSVAQFSDRSLVDLSSYDCVFLCDVPRLGRTEGQ